MLPSSASSFLRSATVIARLLHSIAVLSAQHLEPCGYEGGLWWVWSCRLSLPIFAFGHVAQMATWHAFDWDGLRLESYRGITSPYFRQLRYCHTARPCGRYKPWPPPCGWLLVWSDRHLFDPFSVFILFLWNCWFLMQVHAPCYHNR